MAIVVPRSSSVARARSYCARIACRPPAVAVDIMSNSGERVIRPDSRDSLATDEAIPSLVADIPEVVHRQEFMPGAWLHERREQSTLETLEESILDRMPWILFRSCAQMGVKSWAHVSGFTSIIAALNRGSNDLVTIGRKSEDARFPVCQGLDASDLDAGVSTTAVLNETEQLGVAPDRLPSELSPSPENLGESTMEMHNRRCELPAMGGVAIRDPDSVSSNADREDMSLDGDESASEDGSDGGLSGISSHRGDISPLDRKDVYRVLGRQQDNALSDTGCPFSLRRARSTGHLSNTRDVFDDDDEGTGGDFYWTEQVNARLSGERDFRPAQAPVRSDGCSWPREGREDESDNWRTRSSQVFGAREEPSDALQCQVDSNSTKLRRYSSPPLSANASVSDRAGRYVYV